jgi:hypothetical protein
MRRKPRLLTDRDVLGSEVARVRDDVDPVDFEDFPRRPGGACNSPMSTTWLVTSSSTISLCLASTAIWTL